ncbi:MAG: hypothetical protein JWP94_2206 [Mucilaginibacter sp.]|nr:hypothetical protein [Mucilaginibacter sp.]
MSDFKLTGGDNRRSFLKKIAVASVTIAAVDIVSVAKGIRLFKLHRMMSIPSTGGLPAGDKQI